MEKDNLGELLLDRTGTVQDEESNNKNSQISNHVLLDKEEDNDSNSNNKSNSDVKYLLLDRIDKEDDDDEEKSPRLNTARRIEIEEEQQRMNDYRFRLMSLAQEFFDWVQGTTDRIAYSRDKLLSTSSGLIAFQLLITLSLTVIGSLLYFITSTDTYGEALWKSWVFVADPGSHGAETNVSGRIVGLIIAMGGLVTFAMLLSIVNETLGSYLKRLREGHSKVLESDHIMVIGWNSRVIPFLEDLTFAPTKSCVVLLTSTATTEEIALSLEAHNFHKKIDIVVRTCASYDVSHLNRASILTAKSVIILSDENNQEKSDLDIIGTILIVMQTGFKRRIIVELFDKKYEEIIKLATNSQGISFVAAELLATVVLQCMASHRLTRIYDEVMSLRGNEFHKKEYLEFIGRPFGEIVCHFEDSIVCGWQVEDDILLLPEIDAPCPEGAELIFLAVTVERVDPRKIPHSYAEKSETKPPQQPPLNILVINLKPKMQYVMDLVYAFTGPGTVATFIAPYEDNKEIQEIQKLINHERPDHFTSVILSVDLLDPGEIDSVMDKLEKPLDRIIMFPHVLDQESDEKTMMTILLLKSALEKKNNTNCELVIEVLRDKTKQQLETFAQKSGFIVENYVVGCWLAESAIYCDNYEIIIELFSPGGSDIYYKPLSCYCKNELAISFWDIQCNALSRGELAIGWHEPSQSHILNPADKSTPLLFEEGTQIIVLANDNAF